MQLEHSKRMPRVAPVRAVPPYGTSSSSASSSMPPSPTPSPAPRGRLPTLDALRARSAPIDTGHGVGLAGLMPPSKTHKYEPSGWQPRPIEFRAARDTDWHPAAALRSPAFRSTSAGDQDVYHQDALTSPPDEGEQPMPAKKPRKRKKMATYHVRKQTKAALQLEVEALVIQLERLRKTKGLVTHREDHELARLLTTNRDLRQSLHTQQLALAEMQSLLTRNSNDFEQHPLTTFIRLGRNLNERRATLLALRREILRVSAVFIHETLRFVDESRLYDQRQEYTSESGDTHFQRIEVRQFTGARSVRAVYDAVVYFLYNMEISLSEHLDHLTVREDIDLVDTRISNHRLVSTFDSNVVQELNIVTFAEFTAGRGVVRVESVDEDELYPYSPAERVRKDVTVAITVDSFHRPVPSSAPCSSQPSPASKSNPSWKSNSKSTQKSKVKSDGAPADTEDNQDGELVVVFKRCIELTIRRPAFSISQAARLELESNLIRWGEVMVSFINESLDGPHPQ